MEFHRVGRERDSGRVGCLVGRPSGLVSSGDKVRMSRCSRLQLVSLTDVTQPPVPLDLGKRDRRRRGNSTRWRLCLYQTFADVFTLFPAVGVFVTNHIPPLFIIYHLFSPKCSGDILGPAHPSGKRHGNRFGDVWGLLLTDRQTNKRRWKHHLAGGGNNLFR